MVAGRDSCYRDELASLTPALRAFARALVDAHQTEAADELVQTALVQALGEAHDARGLRLGLLSKVVNAHRRSLRSARLDQQAGANNRAAPHGTVSGARWSLARRVIARDAHRLDEMPVEWREPFLLVTLESLTYVQTAECLGTTLNAVIQNLARAREHLSETGSRAKVRRDEAGHRTVPYLRLVK